MALPAGPRPAASGEGAEWTRHASTCSACEVKLKQINICFGPRVNLPAANAGTEPNWGSPGLQGPHWPGARRLRFPAVRPHPAHVHTGPYAGRGSSGSTARNAPLCLLTCLPVRVGMLWNALTLSLQVNTSLRSLCCVSGSVLDTLAKAKVNPRQTRVPQAWGGGTG